MAGKPSRRKGAGRPRREITPEEEAQIEKLASVLTQRQIADFLGMSHETLRTRMLENPDLRVRYDRGRAKAVAGVGSTVLQRALAGDPIMARFYLITQGGWKERQDIGVGGIDDGPLEVVVTRKIIGADDQH